VTTFGYGKIVIQGKQCKAHRVSWELNVGPIPKDKWVLHKCDVRNCVNPDHLFLGNALINNQDCKSKGRNNVGEINGNAKLTTTQVIQIRQWRRGCGILLKDLATQFGIQYWTAYMIRKGEAWKHVAS